MGKAWATQIAGFAMLKVVQKLKLLNAELKNFNKQIAKDVNVRAQNLIDELSNCQKILDG